MTRGNDICQPALMNYCRKRWERDVCSRRQNSYRPRKKQGMADAAW